jgi:hypothetical protein
MNGGRMNGGRVNGRRMNTDMTMMRMIVVMLVSSFS